MMYWCHRITLAAVLFLAMMFSLAGCGPDGESASVDLSETVAEPDVGGIQQIPGEYRFGFDLRASPQEDSRQYKPFLDYLEKATGYRFRLHFVRKDKGVVQQLGSGTVQFAAMGAVSSIKAQLGYGAIPIVRGLNKEGRPSYRAMIVVAPGSPIRNLAELRGKRLAFGNINSTQGHVIPRIMMREAGFGLEDLPGYFYAGSHRNCANAVISGKADACGMQDTMALNLADQNLLRVIKASREYPSSGITANAAVPQAVIDKVRRALIEFDPLGRHAQGLYNWDQTEMPSGFIVASPNDYAELRDWLARLGLLTDSETK